MGVRILSATVVRLSLKIAAQYISTDQQYSAAVHYDTHMGVRILFATVVRLSLRARDRMPPLLVPLRSMRGAASGTEMTATTTMAVTKTATGTTTIATTTTTCH